MSGCPIFVRTPLRCPVGATPAYKSFELESSTTTASPSLQICLHLINLVRPGHVQCTQDLDESYRSPIRQPRDLRVFLALRVAMEPTRADDAQGHGRLSEQSSDAAMLSMEQVAALMQVRLLLPSQSFALIVL